ncbi:general L-amino acid transport system permease protein [Alkalibacterium subtropicum]|uniref:General L-amino acid transport system permease protein n=1 Tax=Alkalibacterium subtropicum TaxID=753702 RepID=A0A1I1JTU9_9LACT|nr:amino acid ABC transporter permease [Alkalibacterium subtropicum]SFC52004.1 general L-amino acid transport system permease protein [Alkalibacterium subtropicum]
MYMNNYQQEGDYNTSLEVADGIRLKPVNDSSFAETLRKNLFDGWKNTLLTLLTAIFSLFLVYQVVTFVLANSWDVVYDNLRMLMIGQYPVDEVWRLWLSLDLASLLIGLTYGLWKGAGKSVAFTFGTVYLVFALIPWTTLNTSLNLATAIALIAVGYAAGDKVAKLKLPTLVLWALFIPFSLGLLTGFGGLLDPVLSREWGGWLLTVIIAMISIIGCFPLGVLLALGRRSSLPVVKYFCIGYIELVRGIPLIMVLFIGQLLIPLFLGGETGIDNVSRAIIAYTFFAAAYLAENIRGGLQSIPSGQYEAAQALGLNKFKLTFFIILPQALKAVIPAMVGQFITILKDTSLVAIIGLADFLGTARRISNNPEYLGRYMELYLFVAAFYFVFCYLMAHVSRYLERSLAKGNG